MYHKFGKIQFWLASDIKTTRNKVLSVVIKSETLYVTRLVGCLYISTINSEIALLRQFLVGTEVNNTPDSVTIVCNYISGLWICLCHSYRRRESKNGEKDYFPHNLRVFINCAAKNFLLLIFSLIEYITGQCVAQFKDR